MKLTLRKARRLEQDILTRIDKVNDTQVSFTPFATVPDLDQIEKDYLKEVDVKRKINIIRHNIRKNINDVNHSSGLNKLMAGEAMIKADLRLLKASMSAQIRELDQEQLGALKLRTLEEGSEHRLYGRNQIESFFMTKESMEDLERFLIQSKKAQQDATDQMLSINMSSEIELSEHDVTTLKGLNLL